MNRFLTSQERTTIYGTAKIKLPNSRRSKLIHALNDIDDAGIDKLYFELRYDFDRSRQSIIDIFSTHFDAVMLFEELRKMDINSSYTAVNLLKESIEYMKEQAKKLADKSDATARDINSYRRLYIMGQIEHFARVWNILKGEVTNNYEIDQELLSTE